MANSSMITIYFGNAEPKGYDLDSFQKDAVLMGQGPVHGRDASAPKNDIALDPRVFPFVSRAHCTFYKWNGHWYIRDDNSLNGTLLNSEKVQSRQMHDGDKYYIQKNAVERLVIAFSTGAQGVAGQVSRFSLREKDLYVIGRLPSCDIRIDHPSVSRRHCLITREGGRYYITDNNSMNGVILNGKPLEGKAHLSTMDKITIATASYVFSEEGFLFESQVRGGVSVAVQHLFKKVGKKGREKFITNDVTLSIEPGEFVAIIGGSGAGKSTLLNCISGMTDYTSGEIIINGENVRSNEKSLRSIMGYVPQNDIVYDNLSLERMLYYSAKLRMPQDTTKAEIQNKIEETLKQVELYEHRGTMISKLSGGQRKRASIAVELLASPRLFFLDEPSSGLDPGTEKHLMLMLKRLAESGKTVIMVTHTVQNINLCDRVICMGKGGLLCFSGRPQSALPFFRKQSMTDIYDELNERSIDAAQRFNKLYAIPNLELPPGNAKKEKAKFEPLQGISRFFRQFGIMTRRYMELMFNNKGRLALLLLMPFILTVLVCVAYQADGNILNFGAKYLGWAVNRKSFPFVVSIDTQSLMFAFSCAAFWIGIFNSVQEISKEQDIYRREQFTGVRPLPYVLSKFAVLTLLCLAQTVIMTALFLFLCNTTVTLSGDVSAPSSLPLQMAKDGVVFGSGGMWLEVFVTSFLCVLCAMCLGLAVSSAVSNEMALVICPVCLLPQILFSGVVSALDGITETISNFIPCRWVCIAFFTSAGTNGMNGYVAYDMGKYKALNFLLNNEAKTEVDAYSPVYDAANHYYIFGLNPVAGSWVVLLIMSVVCIAAAVCFLRWKKQKV